MKVRRPQVFCHAGLDPASSDGARAEHGVCHNAGLPLGSEQQQSVLDLQLILELALIGTCTGFLAGLLGIGGGMIMVPFVAMILAARDFPEDLTLKMAVATSLATICFTSLSSVWAHQKRGAVVWPVVKVLAPGILVGSLIGAQIAVALPGKLLGILFAIFVAFSATQILLDRKPKPGRTLPGPLVTFGVGNGIGVVSSVVGAGGAFMSVPFMLWCNVRIHEAVGTSAALGFPIALAGTAGYVWAGQGLPQSPPGAFGYLYVPGLVVISIFSMLLAPVGARTAHRTDTRPLRRAFAVVLYCLAAYFVLR
ncbi:MAG: Uncharacterized UPF0721 integral membrane protein [uncultured Ramlibacter sp.]|uniref:Probable membrane transporter protein n=1 Tax=uncultured Ramlibacter sp. TaxID=260755 RepID=A0A6J4NS93_9BURK|nr:MAG: Uncharacterized UPF0721 integral membrane protein [uncultured Ramlibacter sp.]